MSSFTMSALENSIVWEGSKSIWSNLGSWEIEVSNDHMVLIAFGVIRWHQSKLKRGSKQADNALTVASGHGGSGGIRLLTARMRVCLAAGPGALFEDKSVNFGDNEVLGATEVKCQ
ncbi:hypothetical protein ACFX2F_002706 [Malus domestica]